MCSGGLREYAERSAKQVARRHQHPNRGGKKRLSLVGRALGVSDLRMHSRVSCRSRPFISLSGSPFYKAERQDRGGD